LPPTLGIRVRPTDELLALHYALFRSLPEQTVHLHYRPAYWQPHVKLANIRSDQATGTALVSAVSEIWRETDGNLDGLEVVRYSPVETIWQAPLRRAGV